MAIDLQFDADLSADGKTLTITDETGQYSALNTGGWGAPNPDVAAALTAVMNISKRNSDGSFDAVVENDVYDDLPSDNGGEKELVAEDAGISGDGIYKANYQISGDDSGSTFLRDKTEYFVWTPSIDAGMLQLEAKVAACTSGCEDLKNKFNYLSGLYNLMEAAQECGDLDGIQKYIDLLTKELKDCGCCC